MVQNDGKLRSWKAIANYFDKSEKTVRRWESEQGMPVHRHHHNTASRIFAFTHELENWFDSRNKKPTAKVSVPSENKFSIGIMPFEFLSEDSSRQFVRDAICEDMISALSTLKNLNVISYSSMLSFANQKNDRQVLIAQMQLNYYVEGSLRIVDKQMSINARLVDSINGAVIWNKKYSNPYENWATVYPEIVSDLIRNIPFKDNAIEFASRQFNCIKNQTAWEYVHQARLEAFKWHPDGIKRSIELLGAAEKLVGEHNFILASLGRVYLHQREAGIDFTDKPLRKVDEILQSLEDTDPDAFFTHSLKGWYNYSVGSITKAINSLNQAIELNPNDADSLSLISNCYLLTGQYDLALPYIRAVQIVDPLTPLTTCLPGYHQMLTGDFAEAIEPYEKMLDMNPYNPIARMFLVWIYTLNNERDKVEQTCAAYPSDQQSLLPSKIAFAFRDAKNGEKDGFSLTDSQMLAASVNELFSRFIAFAFAAHGDVDQATKWLSKAHQLGFWSFPFIKYHEPFLKPYHQEEPLKTLLKKIEEKWQQN